MNKLTRRAALAVAAVGLTAPAALTSTAHAHTADADQAKAPIVLVHGAWHGGWAWTRLVPLLLEAGHPTTVVNLSGLGENVHRQAPEIGLHVHGQDVTNHLFYNDIRNAVVVGHSYGGCVLSQALANDSEGRIAHAVYLDALIPGQDQALASFVPEDVRVGMMKAAENGAMLPPRPPELWEKMWGLTGDSAAFAGPRLHPMSARCFTETVQGDPDAHGAKRSFIRCTQNQNRLFDMFAERTKGDPRFAYSDLDGHNDVMVIDPPKMRDGLLAVL